jgi:hypothetical protein
VATDRPASTAAKPPRSRLCNTGRSVADHAYLFEALRELTFETSLSIAGNTLRIGLAATVWQLDQARQLLDQFQSKTSGPRPAALHPSQDRAIALALDVRPMQRKRRAQGLISLRRDNEQGLNLDKTHQPFLDAMRARGASLAEVEHLAFDQKLPLSELLGPMIQALSNSVESWGITDIVAICEKPQMRFYCQHLGFKRIPETHAGNNVLLHLPAGRIARLQARHAAS